MNARIKKYAGILGVSIWGISNCVTMNADLCSRIQVEEDPSLEVTLHSLKAQTSLRGLASLETGSSSHAKLESWSEHRLRETQKNIDFSSRESEFHPVTLLLSKIANRWVEFHAYSESGDLVKMIRTLESIREDRRRAQEMACRRAPKQP